MKARFAVMSALSLLAFAAGAAMTSAERSSAVYPPQKLPLSFDHGMHLAAGASCTSCHGAARKSTSTSDRLLPGHPECSDCHDLEAAERGEKTDPPATCATCHPKFDPTVRRAPDPVVFPAANLQFGHQLHLDQKIPCNRCHGDFTSLQLATRQQLPKMATCLECHDGRKAADACTTCHVAAPSGRLMTEFMSGLLRPAKGNPFGMDHGPRFEFNHGPRALASRTQCMECHAERDCQSCHDAIRKPLSVHPNDWITLHGVQVRANTQRCESCHRLQSFCSACHERAGVSIEAHPSHLTGVARVHPPLEVWVETPGPAHHGVAAVRDLRSCISCHREETCLTCHSERLGGSGRIQGAAPPHPPGFANVCRTAMQRNDRPCLQCHTPERLEAICPQ